MAQNNYHGEQVNGVGADALDLLSWVLKPGDGNLRVHYASLLSFYMLEIFRDKEIK